MKLRQEAGNDTWATARDGTGPDGVKPEKARVVTHLIPDGEDLTRGLISGGLDQSLQTPGPDPHVVGEIAVVGAHKEGAEQRVEDAFVPLDPLPDAILGRLALP